MEHHIQHIVLLRRAVFLCGQTFAHCFNHDLHHDYLAGGPLEYMAAIFRKLADSDEDAMQLALEFYGPMYLLYSVYDGAEKKESASSLLATHIDHFIAKVESDYRKKGRTT